MTFLSLLAAVIFVGWLAQTKKGRTGAFWGMLTAIPILFLWFAVGLARDAAPPPSPTDLAFERRFGAGSGETLSNVLVSLLVGGAMTLIVLTLPKPKD